MAETQEDSSPEMLNKNPIIKKQENSDLSKHKINQKISPAKNENHETKDKQLIRATIPSSSSTQEFNIKHNNLNRII